ncbi:zinc finger protein 40 isoform X2 [Hypomesus transpacificus]|uniref:zinc finger protein 40 isoform X2 n=1 Tax=Hypomesus transpacificus TaxID=137520 RepID=UPI001F081B6B|nr:zinc finger protein 40 isoform X2 [Hypomesus transpacificus]
MPRTKQNHPKNLKDKIEEAQKELKDPKASQKGFNGSSGRSADSIKGLKRKKVVGENQLKKIPKSPVKKPPQAKTSEAQRPSSTTPSCSYSSSPSPDPTSSPTQKHNADDAQPVAASSEGVKHERLESWAPPPAEPQPPEPAGAPPDGLSSDTGASQGRARGREVSCERDSSFHTSAPLEVLLKAMEPDFSTLTQQQNSFQATSAEKPRHPLPARSSGDESAMPAVNFGLQTQSPHMQTYYVDKQGNYIGITSTLPRSMQPSTQPAHLQSPQHFVTSVTGRDKPSLHMSFSAGPSSSTLSHAPVQSGSSTLPQSQPPVVHTCQSLSASVPSTIQVPVTPGYNTVQMATVVNFGPDQMCNISTKDHKPKKQGKYVCEYCSRACAKPSVLLKHIRSHTGERPYPCVTCGFSFKTKSNLYKHKKSHAHAIKLGLVARSDSGSGSLSQESDKVLGAHSDVEESGDSDEESSTADLDPDSSQSSVTALSESSLQSAGTTQGSHWEGEPANVFEALKLASSQRGYEPKGTAALPKVVVYPVNVSPLRADSPRVSESAPEQAAVQRQRDFQTANLRSNSTVLSSLREVDCSNLLQDDLVEEDDPQCKSPLGGGHAQLQRQQATDFSQQQQGKCLLSPRSLGSTDSGYFSRSESADQALSPPSPFVKITPPTDMDVSKNAVPSLPVVVSTVMHVTAEDKTCVGLGQMRPPLETKALSLEERISKLISDNEAVVDNKQLDSVKPRRTSLSRRGSIDSPKSYIFKDSFQFDLKPMGRRSSSSSDIPKSPYTPTDKSPYTPTDKSPYMPTDKSPYTPTDKSKPVFLLSVPPQYPPMDCLPITRSNSMPTTPGHSALPPNVAPQPHPLRICQSFDDKIGSLNDDVFSSAPSTPNPAIHPRTLVRQIAVEDSSTSDGHSLPSVRSMDEGYHGSGMSIEVIQRSRSFEHALDRSRKPQQGKGTMYECETCRNRYRKLENFENHKKFYCSELHGPKNKPVTASHPENDVFQTNMQQTMAPRTTGIPGILENQTSIRKRRKMKSVGDDDDQSPTDTTPPCPASFDSCQPPTAIASRFSQHAVMVELQPQSIPTQVPHIQLVARGTDASESRLSPIREAQMRPGKEGGELQRQGSGTSVIRHTNSLSRPSSFETSESIDRASPVDFVEKDSKNLVKTSTEVSLESYHEKMSIPKCADHGKQGTEVVDGRVAATKEISSPAQQSRLVRQNNIQVPEILVTEEPDRDHEAQITEAVEKPGDTFNWPQRSESLSKLPAEKLPPKKKRIRLAQMDHSSGESSFESSLSRSLSRDSSLSRCSSISASFDRDEPTRSESPSRVESVSKTAEPQGLPAAFNTLGVPGVMRRAASEQISCTQPSVEVSCDYRSKSFDYGSVSPSRSLSPMEQLNSVQTSQVSPIPLIERRRGPLGRQMSLKLGPESQQHTRKQTIPLERLTISCGTPLSHQWVHQIAKKYTIAQPFTLHSGDALLQKNGQMVQSINLGSQTLQPQIHGLPHPWHQISKVQSVQLSQQPPASILVGQVDPQNKHSDPQEKKSFVPKYQLQCPALRTCQTYCFSSTPATQIALPVLTIPGANQILSISKSSDVLHNVYIAQQSHQVAGSIVLPVGPHSDQSQTGPVPLPQILITQEQNSCTPPVVGKGSLSTLHSLDGDIHSVPVISKDRPQPSACPQVKHSIVFNIQNQTTEKQRQPSHGSLHCAQKLPSVTLLPHQEPTASSKRMLSPANSLDIAMEKHQKRVKDEHGAACLTDGRSVNYLNSKMAEVTRQRKLMLVRQVCTTEPADSPIETEAPPLQHEKTDDEAESQETADDSKPMSPDSTGPGNEPLTVVPQEQSNTSPSIQGSPMSTKACLKPQDKSEEQRWTASKSPIRPLTFHGQVKLASSVSVVNTRDSHRLSFPSLKTATTFTWCYLMKRKPLHVPQTDQKISAYSSWAVNPNNPNPLGLPTKVLMSLFDSKQKSKTIHYTPAITTSVKSDILSYSSSLKDIMSKVLLSQKSVTSEKKNKGQTETQPSCESDKDQSALKTEPRRVKIFDGGFKSNEDYVYVRGRGRGKYICEECGIRCKKPSMLRKHIRTHSDVRPYHCTHCNFSFKTKGNLTKHMKSKAHSKKCLEMGVSVSLDDQDAEDSDRYHGGSADRPDSDGDDSEGPDDEDDNEEEEEDSQAESGLSTNPSVSASPLHFPSNHEGAPSALLAQMSISPAPLPQPPASDLHPSDPDSVPMMSPVSLCRQMSIAGACSSPLAYSPPPAAPGLPSDSHTSDTESVHMMSPVSPCRQMSIDYPDFEVPPSPPPPGWGSKLCQAGSPGSSTLPAGEVGVPVDRGTQTASFAPQSTLHFPSSGLGHNLGTGSQTQTHLFSHLPLHSQQPCQAPYSMIPVGGIQLVPAGLAAYSTFFPIQAGPVQLTIPAMSVLHRNSSPLLGPSSSPQPEGSTSQPLVVQEPLSSVLPCFPLGQVTGLQAQTLQPLNVMGLTNTGLASSQLLSQQGLALNAALGLQVLATSPSSQSSPQAHIPGLQILNIALPALIPALSPLAALSPLPGPSETRGSPQAPDRPRGNCPSASLPSSSPPLVTGPQISGPSPREGEARSPQVGEEKEEVEFTPGNSAASRAGLGSTETPSVGGAGEALSQRQDSELLPQKQASELLPQKQASEVLPQKQASELLPQRQASELLPQRQAQRQPVTEDSEASSDDEDRLVIAT